MNTNIEYENTGDLIEELQHELTIWKECADGLQEAYERKDFDDFEAFLKDTLLKQAASVLAEEK